MRLGRAFGIAAIAVLLAVTGTGVGVASAVAAPNESGGSAASPLAAPAGVNLRLDGHAASRLLADAKESDAAAGDDKAKANDKPGDKSDEIKLTVSKGTGAKKATSSGSEDTFAFVKDWPFWAIVGGVVIVGAAVYMINRNNSQEHNCPGEYNAGCFGAK